MALETGNYINDLVITSPTSTDPKSQGDDHLRLIKTVLKETLNGFTGAILVTAADTGTATGHILTPSTALIAYTPALCLLYKPAVTNTGAITVNVSGLGVKSIKTMAGADPTAGDIVAGYPMLLMYDGTKFITLGGSEFLSKTGNQTLTGNLNVTGLTTLNSATGLTRSLGDSTTNLATTAFVAATAFSSALPAQTGNSGKFVTTNGSVASWGEVLNKGCVVAPLAGGTLPNDAISSLLANASYTLSDLTLGDNSVGLMAVSNSASVPATVSTSDGWQITTGMTAGTVSVIQPTSRETAHGTWGSVPMTPPTLATLTTASAPTIVGTVMMPNSILLVAYTDSNGLSVAALDTVNNTFGSAVLVSATYIDLFTIHQDTATTFVCNYNSTGAACRAGSLSGTAITLGSQVNYTNSLFAPVVQLQAGSYIAIVNGNFIQAASVAGTVITVGTSTATGMASAIAAIKISSTTALICGKETTTQKAQALVVTVSGTSLSLGAVATSAVAVSGGTTGNLIAFDATNFLFTNGPSTLSFYCCCVVVSGTTCTIGTVASLVSTIAAAVYAPTTYDYNPRVPFWTYSSTQILFALTPNVGLIVITRSGSTLTIGPQQLSQAYGASNNFFQDYAKTTLYYGDGASKFSKITSVTGISITSAEQVAAGSTMALTTTLTNEVVKYLTTWYVWNLSVVIPVSATKALNIANNTIKLHGTIS